MHLSVASCELLGQNQSDVDVCRDIDGLVSMTDGCEDPQSIIIFQSQGWQDMVWSVEMK